MKVQIYNQKISVLKKAVKGPGFLAVVETG
jgi:hypothetical protein